MTHILDCAAPGCTASLKGSLHGAPDPDRARRFLTDSGWSELPAWGVRITAPGSTDVDALARARRTAESVSGRTHVVLTPEALWLLGVGVDLAALRVTAKAFVDLCHARGLVLADAPVPGASRWCCRSTCIQPTLIHFESLKETP
jgi:hypothetical protein